MEAKTYEEVMAAYTGEDTKAYNDVLALNFGGKHHRLQMISVARRSKVAEKGRSLGKGMYLALDEFENPMLQYRGSPNASPTTFLHFVVGGFFLIEGSYLPRETGSMQSYSISKYSIYTNHYGFKGYVPRDYEKMAKQAGHINHGNASAYGTECDCDDCKTLYSVWNDRVMKKNKEFANYVKEMALTFDPEKRVFIPYANPDEEKIDMSWLPSEISIEAAKVAKARDWNRKDKTVEEKV